MIVGDGIGGGGGSGVLPLIKVTGLTSTDTLTASCGGKTISAVWKTDHYEISPTFFGTWVLTATDGTSTATENVLVYVVRTYDVEMSL